MNYVDQIKRILAHVDIERAILGSWPERISSEMVAAADALEPLRKLASREVALMTDDAWENVADQALRSITPTHSGWTRESEGGLQLIIWLERLANEHRKPGEMDPARAITGHMQAFASKLAARFPEEAPARLAVCLVFDAIAEIALLADDQLTVEKNWKLALAKAQEAMLLDPRDERVRAEMVRLQERLDWRKVWVGSRDRFLPQRGKPVSTGGTVQTL